MSHQIAMATVGEICRMCGQDASHKVCEDMTGDGGHGLSAYVCCKCFGRIFGPVAKRQCWGTRFGPGNRKGQS